MLNSYIQFFGKSILKYVSGIMFNYFDQIFIFSQFLSALSLSLSLYLVLSCRWIGLVFAVAGLTFVMPFARCLYMTSSVKRLLYGLVPATRDPSLTEVMSRVTSNYIQPEIILSLSQALVYIYIFPKSYRFIYF